MERAEHAGDVAQGAALDAALAEGAGGLALEVDDREVAAGVQDLAEVVVAVRADAEAADLAVEDGAEARLQVGVARDQ